MNLSGKHIILGVSGGIAAYKSPDLVRRLREAGAVVRVVLTRGAEAFITPLTFQAVSHQPVHTHLLDAEAETGMGHLELARWADHIVIAPATADCMARLAHGMADDLLTTLCLASEAPITLCPAMNHIMWQAQATQDNAETLAKRGMRMLGPVDGALAEGESGPGRLMEPRDIVSAIQDNTGHPMIRGKRILITAGPTHEPIDPVRYIANRSSGRMGFALAQAAASAGAQVTLISGPARLTTPAGVARIDVETAEQMHNSVMQQAAQADIFIAAAAVADYRAEAVANQKVKKSEAPTTLQLKPNPDILQAVAKLTNGPFTVGFAAETESVREHAQIKLEQKHLDMIAANQVGDGIGFDVDTNTLDVLWANGEKRLGPASKIEVAAALIQLIGERLNAAG